MLTKKITPLFMLVLTFSFANAQETVNAQFTHYGGDISEYLRDGFREEFRKFFDPNGDFVYSVTLDLLVDENGNVEDIDIIENSSNEKFDFYLKRKMMNTSGIWKITTSEDNSNKQLHLIIPFRLHVIPTYTNVNEIEIGNRSKALGGINNNLSLETLGLKKLKKNNTFILNEVFIGFFETHTNENKEDYFREMGPK